VDIVAAVRVGDVFRLRHEPGEPFLGLFLHGIGDVELLAKCSKGI
jgi:hypothetical protein